MKIQVNNIEFNYHTAGSDLISDEDNIGIGHLTIPGTMTARFMKECGQGLNLPHYEEEDRENVFRNTDHDCYNADTQIVLMSWLFRKKRKYKLDYYGLDPFWMFHDACHAKNDVHGYEVNNIHSRVEKERLIQGAEFASKHRVHISADTLIKLDDAWTRRWRFREGEGMAKFDKKDFYKYMTKTELKAMDSYEYFGILPTIKLIC